MARIDQSAFPYSLKGFYDALVAYPNLLNESEAVTTGASPTALDITVYQTLITSGATEGTEEATIGNGTGAIIGQRKLVRLVTRSHASDVVALDEGNIINSAGAALDVVAFDAANEYLLVEWTGAKWKEIYSTCTMTPS